MNKNTDIPEFLDDIDVSLRRFHILSDTEIDSIQPDDSLFDTTTTLDEIAAMDFDDYEVVPDEKAKKKEKKEKKRKEKKTVKIDILSTIKKKQLFDRNRLKAVFSFILIIVLLFISIGIIFYSCSSSLEKTVSYAEDSDIRYKVYLKDNEEYLDNDMTFDSSLIQLIKLHMNYQFHISEKSDIHYQYAIYATLYVVDKNNPKKVYYNSRFVLLEEETNDVKKVNDFSISENVSIDYPYYNDLSKRFRTSYGTETEHYLLVTLVVREISDKHSSLVLDQISSPSIQIPLGSDSIQLTVNNIKNSKTLLSDKLFPIKNIPFFVLGAILLIFSIIVIIKFFYLLFHHQQLQKLNRVKRYEKRRS